jgi:hypothetical protein
MDGMRPGWNHLIWRLLDFLPTAKHTEVLQERQVK